MPPPSPPPTHTASPHPPPTQCFCFEEQRIQPHETIDMPVLFFIDKDFLADPSLTQTETVTLSYTFFKAGEEDQTFVEGECVGCEV
jgi:cytochrome c oxidase assembly protein subunit 11